MEKKYKILTINPGSTSTKVAVFENEKELFGTSISHSRLELERFERVWDQYEFRKRLIKELLEENNFKPTDLSAVVGRGGLFRPVVGGTYEINQLMIEDGRRAARGEHASNLGAVLAFGLGWDFKLPAFIVDPPSVDEFFSEARVSGLKDTKRESLFHALNIKATARQAAEKIGKPFEELNFVVAHLGGGISVAAVLKGQAVDSNNALTSGPFTPERAGDVSSFILLDLCFSEKYNKKQIQKLLVGRGGLSAHLGTNDCREVEKRIKEGDENAKRVYNGMIYRISAEIGSRVVALKGKVDAILLTGGMAYSDYVVEKIKEWVGFLGPIMVLPGQDEMKALALGALRILKGEEKAKTYPETVE
ncbi:MAG: butyrate kinase [candidate division Zixibacteria bacterium]|nr:butyrate kinase [candidate division Zixibacteria bacterium]